MTKEQLLQPRYLIINDFPFNVYFKKGETITLTQLNPEKGYYDTFNSTYFLETSLFQFPHLFRRIDWNIDRKAEDMPLYLKFMTKDKVEDIRRVSKWLYEDDIKNEGSIVGFEYFTDYHNMFEMKNPEGTILEQVGIYGWLPSTEEEYKEFHKDKMLK